MEGDDILVEMKAVSLNPVDFKLVESGFKGYAFPRVIGLDGAGVVVDVGSKVKNFKNGDRVFFHSDLTKSGVFASFAKVKADAASLILDPFGFDLAAAIPCAAYTAYHALFQKLPNLPRKWIFIQGAAGGVGAFAVLLAKKLGLRVIGSGSQKDEEYLKSLGVDCFMDYHSKSLDDFASFWSEDGGLDVAFLSQPLETDASWLFKHLAFNGSIISLLGFPNSFVMPPFLQSLSLIFITLGGAYTHHHRVSIKNLGLMGQELMKLLSPKEVDGMVAQRISFEEIPDALREFSKGKLVRSGKIVAIL